MPIRPGIFEVEVDCSKVEGFFEFIWVCLLFSGKSWDFMLIISKGQVRSLFRFSINSVYSSLLNSFGKLVSEVFFCSKIVRCCSKKSLSS